MASHDELPLPDYDNLPVGSIESRIRTLGEQGVRRLYDYEKEHADRVQVVQILRNRLVALNSGEAEPSGGDPGAGAPEAGPEPAGGSKASPATQGPAQNPPSQGVPTNPAQPRR
jgi:hypothetical protein